MKLLALDTATEACSAALGDATSVVSRYELPGRGHAERLLPMVDELLTESGLALKDLGAIAFGRGPGAFTGVRIAIAVAQGLAFGAGLKVVPVSDLAALALGALEQAARDGVVNARALVGLDARMGEVYWALAERRSDGGVGLLTERLDAPATAAAALQAALGEGPLVGAGHGFKYPALAECLPSLSRAYPELLPSAVEVLKLGLIEADAGRLVGAEDAEPVYLRNDVAARSGAKPSG